MKAILVKDILKGFIGHAALYRMEPPLDDHGFVIASATSLTPTGPETYLFPADAEGNVASWAVMDGSYRGGLSHAKAFAGVGYSIEIPAQAASSELEDAARYRFLAARCRITGEHWGGRWSIVVEGPAPESHDSKDDFDAAIDAARKPHD